MEEYPKGRRRSRIHKLFKTNWKIWVVQCKEQNDTKRKALKIIWTFFSLLWLHGRMRPSKAWGTSLFYYINFHAKIQQYSFALKHVHTHTDTQICICYPDLRNSLTWGSFVGKNGKRAQYFHLALKMFELMQYELYSWIPPPPLLLPSPPQISLSLT